MMERFKIYSWFAIIWEIKQEMISAKQLNQIKFELSNFGNVIKLSTSCK